MSKPTDRRTFLSGALAGTAGAAAMLSLEENILLAAMKDGTTEAKRPEGQAASMPCGKIGDLNISRMIMGGNLIGGWAHSRDLMYVSKLFKAYNTEEKIFETFELGEQQGVNMVQVDPSYQDIVEKYKKERGGKIQTMICMHPSSDESQTRDQIKRLVDKGATTLYSHGAVADKCVMQDNIDVLGKALDLIKQEGLTAGIGSHSLEVPIASEKNNLDPDYYVKTFHPDRYWSATPKEDREEWCWHKGHSADHDKYHDNIFCLDAQKTAEFMHAVEKPWVAFKILAAGAIHPRIGFSHAFKNGADFICVGMFDFQVADNAQLTRDVIKKTGTRKRPWRA